MLHLLAFLMAAGSPVFARTYYVANAGSDSNVGTSPTAPWKTIAHVNRSKFTPGDQILFNRGDEWYEMLAPPSAGAPDNVILFSAFGSGPLPIVDAQNTRQHAIYILNAGYVTLQHLQLQDVTFTSHGETMLHILKSPHVTVSRCLFKNNVAASAIYLDAGSPFLVVDSNIAVHEAGKAAGRFLSSAVTTTSDHPIISNNIVPDPDGMVQHQIGTFDVDDVDFHGNTVSGGGIALQIHSCNRLVTRSKIYDNYLVGSNRREGDGEIVELTGRNDGSAHAPSCSGGDGQGTTFTVTASIYRNFVLFGRATKNGISGFYAVNSDIYNNLVINTVGSNNGNAFAWTTNSNNNRFYNNSVYFYHGAAFQFTSSPCCNTYKNNIVKGPANFYATDCPACIIDDYNLTNMSKLEGRGVRPGAHTLLNTDPRWVNPSPAEPGDFRLLPTSPAIGSGISLGTPYNLGLDPREGIAPPKTIDRATRGTSWDRGATVYFPPTWPFGEQGYPH